MPAVCASCQHPERRVFDLELRDGESWGTVSARTGIPITSLRNHYRAHVEPTLGARKDKRKETLQSVAIVQAERVSVALATEKARSVRVLAESEIEHATSLARLSEKVAHLVAGATLKQIESAGEGAILGGDALYEVLAAIKGAVEARGGGLRVWAESLAKLTGELAPTTQTVVIVKDGKVVHPDIARMLNVIEAALVPHQEAWASVATALRDFERSERERVA